MRYSTTEFETIYVKCFPAAMRLAVSLLHEEDEARDVVQEVFVKLWESDFRIENHAAFIIRAVRNACLNRINLLDNREKIRRRLTLEPPPEDYDPDQRHEEVTQAIKSLLTLREQQVVEQIYTHGMSYKEASKKLEVSEATINKNIVTALKKLRNHFKSPSPIYVKNRVVRH
ncbi:MAG: sigma-70 family RNA polymerase sigma factor [Muribaculaceae bacterium]|nr:sigma-70 family RNA polymerase sigma factor [Muribaculaceae bacterium]